MQIMLFEYPKTCSPYLYLNFGTALRELRKLRVLLPALAPNKALERDAKQLERGGANQQNRSRGRQNCSRGVTACEGCSKPQKPFEGGTKPLETGAQNHKNCSRGGSNLPKGVLRTCKTAREECNTT